MKKVLEYLLSFLSLIIILLMILYSKMLGLEYKVGQEKRVFVLLPKIIDGKIYWLTFLIRKVEYNRDFISWPQYRYYKEK